MTGFRDLVIVGHIFDLSFWFLGNLYIVSDVPESSEPPDMSDVSLTSSDSIVTGVEESGPLKDGVTFRLTAFLGLVIFLFRKPGFSRSIGFTIDFDR